MAYVVTDACIKDFVCVAECATAAIAPAAGRSRRRNSIPGLHQSR